MHDRISSRVMGTYFGGCNEPNSRDKHAGHCKTKGACFGRISGAFGTFIGVYKAACCWTSSIFRHDPDMCEAVYAMEHDGDAGFWKYIYIYKHILYNI